MTDHNTRAHINFLADHIRSAIFLYDEFDMECRRGLNRRDLRLLCLLDSYLFQLGRICNLLDPVRGGKKYADARARGAALLRRLQLPPASLEHIRAIRNRVEHLDEDIDAYLASGPSAVLQVICDNETDLSGFKIESPDKPGVSSRPFRSLCIESGAYTSGRASIIITRTLGDIGDIAKRVLALMENPEGAIGSEFKSVIERIERHQAAYWAELVPLLSLRGFIYAS